MKLHLACSGGFANLRIEGSVDTAELPEELARRVERAFHPEKLAAAGTAAADPRMADGQQYELTLLPAEVKDFAAGATRDPAKVRYATGSWGARGMWDAACSFCIVC